MTAVHSASASLLAKRQGKEDTVRLLRSQVRGLLQKIDMDGKMKKMAELQLTVVSNPKNRKAIENQVSLGLHATLNRVFGPLCNCAPNSSTPSLPVEKTPPPPPPPLHMHVPP